MFFLLFVTNVKHGTHTIRIMFEYDYKYVILLDKLRNGEDFFLNLDTLYSGGGVNYPFRWTVSRLIYHIYKFFILLYCRISLHTCNV